MTDGTSGTLVFKDQAGNYFVLPQETLERGRVPAEHRAEVERLVAGSEVFSLAEREDVQGYFAPLAYLIGCAVVGAAAAIGIGFTGPTVETGGGGGSSQERKERIWTGRMQ